MAHQLIQRIVRTIRENSLLQPGDKVITGYSGGIDSTALLHILASCDLGLRPIAVYIDHGLRPSETEAELHLTRHFAETLGIEYHTIKIDVKTYRRQERCSLEEAARILRYRAIEEIRIACRVRTIAVAHTADDQVEEFLLRLVRGSGLKGLSGMDFRRGNIIRPLLAESKQNLLEYLKYHQLPYCHDSSNDDLSFLRNRIRHTLLPELESQYNPAIRSTILQTTAILGQEEEMLESLATELFTKVCTITPGKGGNEPPQTIICAKRGFIETHPALQRRVLEKICWAMKSRPSFRTLLQLQHLVASGTAGAKLHLSQGLRVRIAADSACFSHPQGIHRWRGEEPHPKFDPRRIPAPGRYIFPEIGRQLEMRQASQPDLDTLPDGTLAVDAGKLTFPLVVRLPQPGEKMQPLGAPGHRKISRIYNDLKVPAALRNRYPLIVSEDGPVALLGLKIADSCRIDERTGSTVLLLTWRPVSTAA